MRRNENFGDMINRLFPGSNRSLTVCGNHVYNITMQVTEDCNMKCTYCYQHDKTHSAMTFETAKKFLDLILASDERSERYIKSKESQGVVIEFIGGEPLLEIDLISQISDYFIEQLVKLKHPWATRFRFSFCTNGLLYFDDRVQEYIKKHKSHLSISITIDGNKELHDMCRIDTDNQPTYDRAIAAVNYHKEHYHENTGTKLTISPDNVSLCGEAIIDYVRNGEPIINANCVYEKGWEIKHASVLYNELKRVADYLVDNNLIDNHYVSILDWDAIGKKEGNNTWCGGSGLMISLAPSGDIYPCIRYTPSSMGTNQKLLKIGDVEHGFVYNKEQEETIDAFKGVTRCGQCAKTEYCSDCPISQGCGDCAAYSYEVYGEIGRRTTYHCDMHKARSLAQVYYRNKKEPYSTPLNCPKEWAIPIIGEEEYNKLYESSKR